MSLFVFDGRIRRREQTNGIKELPEAFSTALHRSAKRVPTTAHDTRRSLLGSTIVVLRHRATYRVIALSYHYAPSPPQVIKGAHIHETAANPSFFPSPTISAFSPFPPFCSSAPQPPNNTPIYVTCYLFLQFSPTMPRLPSSPT